MANVMWPPVANTIRGLLAATLLAAVCAVVAQPYPSRPVSIIVPYSAGGETDVSINIRLK